MNEGERYIRSYHEADQSQVEWLYSRTPPAGQIAVQPQTVGADLQQIPTFYVHFLVAIETQRRAEAIVGMLGIERVGLHETAPLVPPQLRLPPLTGRLRHVAVAPERQRTGVGRLLVEAALKWCKQHEYDSVILETTPQQEAAVNLYLALGFNEIARSEIGAYDLIWFEHKFGATVR